MLIGSLVELHAWLHSYLCFSFLEKLFLSNLDSFSTPGYLSSFSTSFSHYLDSFSIVGGSIEFLYYLFCWIIPQQILDSCICRSLLCTTPVSTTLFIEIYWTPIYLFSVIRLSFCSTSFSIYPSFHLPNLSHSLQTSSSRFLQAFSSFSSLGKLLISHFHAFHVLKPRIWGFWKILRFFKIDWVFVEILGWVFV